MHVLNIAYREWDVDVDLKSITLVNGENQCVLKISTAGTLENLRKVAAIINSLLNLINITNFVFVYYLSKKDIIFVSQRVYERQWLLSQNAASLLRLID